MMATVIDRICGHPDPIRVFSSGPQDLQQLMCDVKIGKMSNSAASLGRL